MPARRLAVSAVLFAVVLNRATPLDGQKFRLHKVLVALGLHRETIGFEFLSSVRISSISEFDFIFISRNCTTDAEELACGFWEHIVPLSITKEIQIIIRIIAASTQNSIS
jgi:hypothetical protein